MDMNLGTLQDIRDGRFVLKVGQIGMINDKSGTFSYHNSVHFGSVSKMYWNVIWKGPRFVIFGGQSDTHRTQIWHPYSKHLNYTLHTQILAVDRPNTRTQPLLWAMLIRVTRLVAYLCTILSSPYTSNQFNETHLLSTVNQSRRRILRPIYLHDMFFFFFRIFLFHITELSTSLAFPSYPDCSPP